ncbi:uncharacterized protein ALTATR162_LOCUS7059 [Alternaria atra]|uniref:Uncharacterized protein n=1 Tax=Alternaria atra TaxID=119953 RepID=A0A8J2N165_9PLEO|nr:uncharacterized protein ALTATR162_LOCUS7059 [Alternaria atra]CAG5169637.1 unnamed protein product [Alternaria atra]
MSLQNFGIIYNTTFQYEQSESEETEDVHFNFHLFAEQCKLRGIHFDYVIRLHHGQDHDCRQRLVPTRLILDEEVTKEYEKHLDSTFDPVHYNLQGITRPAFFEKNDDEYTVYRDGDDDN